MQSTHGHCDFSQWPAEPEASELAELDLSFSHNETLPDARTGTCPLMCNETAACIPLTKAKATPCPGHPDFELSEPVWAPFNVYRVFVVFVVPGHPSNMAQPNLYRAGPQGFAEVCINIFIVSPWRRSPTAGPSPKGSPKYFGTWARGLYHYTIRHGALSPQLQVQFFSRRAVA